MSVVEGTISRGSATDSWKDVAWRVALVGVALVGLAFLPFSDTLRTYEFDLLTSLTAPAPPDSGILVVGLDEVSLAQLGLAPPLPRHLHADLIRAVTDGGAAALGVDMLFTEPQMAHDDQALAQALQGTLPVVLASAAIRNDSSQVASYTQELPSVFPQAVRGDVAMSLDIDGVPRAVPRQPDAMWRVLMQQAGRSAPNPPEGALLRYYAPEVPLPYAHYSQVLDAARQLPQDALRGRMVLMGQNTPVGGFDLFRTPFSALGSTSWAGVFLHATALINGLHGDWIRPIAPPIAWLVALLVTAAAAVLTRRWNALRALAVHATLGVAAVAATVSAFVAGWWLGVAPIVIGLAVHWNLGAGHSYLRERARRQRLRADFARYVPPAVVDALVASDMEPHVQGERRTLTLLFSDLAGFTTASESLEPEAVARALNLYFTRMTRCVRSHGGTLDKFIGDAVMAFWNAPLPDANHAAKAVACAQAMQREMEVLRAEWQGTPFAGVRLRIGIHTGDAAVGHMGSAERFTYTAVGDTVNTAARMEASNKAFGTEVLVSEATMNAIAEGGLSNVWPLWLDSVVVAGRSSGIDVYTLCEDRTLSGLGDTARRHVHAGHLHEALQTCEAWASHAREHAPQWLAPARQLKARLEAVLENARAKGQTEPIELPPRQLTK